MAGTLRAELAEMPLVAKQVLEWDSGMAAEEELVRLRAQEARALRAVMA